MAVITISRQYGTGRDEIAQRVCESLGYHLVVNAGLWGVDGAVRVVADAVGNLPEV